MSDPHATLREELRLLLEGGKAHAGFDSAIDGLPARLRSARPEGVPHTPWRLLEHMRLAQRDILDFSRDPDHESPPWPEGYWPDGDAPPNDTAWDGAVESFRSDLRELVAMIGDESNDLLTPLPGTDGATLLREALILADHNAYHVAQIIMVRRLLGAWS